MARIAFRDCDEFTAALNGVIGRFVPTARAEQAWCVQSVPVRRVVLQLTQTGGGATFAGAGTENAISLCAPISESLPMRIDGDPLRKNSVLLLEQGQPLIFAAPHSTQWACMIVPLDHELLTAELRELVNTKTSAGKHSAQVQMPAPDAAHARRLMSQLCSDDSSAERRQALATRAAEEELVRIIAHALASSNNTQHRHIGRPRLSRQRVLDTALELIAANTGQQLLLQDLRRATHVSERTLRNVFLEYFGVGPTRLLRVLQLHEIRSALLATEYGERTVADIAASFGVWDFSSFARHYRALYNEAPSYTLRRATVTGRRAPAIGKSWIYYAAQKFRP